MSERMQLTHDDWYTMDLQDWMVMVNNYYDLVAKQPIGLEDGPDYHRELLSFTSQQICHALDILEGKE